MSRLVAIGVLLLTACGGGDPTDAGASVDAGPSSGAHMTGSWRLRCTGGDCPATEPPARSIDHDDAQEGHQVRCDVTVDGEQRRMDLTVRGPGGYGFEVRNARIGLGGGRLMGSFCQIRVFEPGDVNLLTACSSNNPTADTACQFSRVDIRSVDDVPTLFAQLRCVDAPEEGRPRVLRDVTSPASTSAAELVFTGCEGL